MLESVKNAFNSVTNLITLFVPSEYTVKAGSTIRCNQVHTYFGYTHNKVNISFSLPRGTIVTTSDGNRMRLEKDFVLPTATNLILEANENSYVMVPRELLNEDGVYSGESISQETVLYILVFRYFTTRFHFNNSKLLKITGMAKLEDTTYNVRDSTRKFYCGRYNLNTLDLSNINNYAIITPKHFENELQNRISDIYETLDMSFDFKLTENLTIKDTNRFNRIKVEEITNNTAIQNTDRNRGEEGATSPVDTNIDSLIDIQSEHLFDAQSEEELLEEHILSEIQENNSDITEEVEDSDNNGGDEMDGEIQLNDNIEHTQQRTKEEKERERVQKEKEREKAEQKDRVKRLKKEAEQQRAKEIQEQEKVKKREEQERKKREEQERKKREEQEKKQKEEQAQQRLKKKQEREKKETRGS